MPYQPNVAPSDPNLLMNRIQAAMQQLNQPTQETDGMRDARLFYKHGLAGMDDPNMQAPTGLNGLYGQSAALKGAAKDSVKSAVMSM